MRAKKAPQKVRNARRKWVEALRSGAYKQCQGALSREMADGSEQFCCLGVLGRVIDPTFADRSASSHLGDWFDIAAGVFGRIRQRLSSMNDNHGLSFEQIAALIEKNIELPPARFSDAMDVEGNRLWDHRYGRHQVPK